jgi:LPPG:FO 2-phospho-L-lactate transferase
LEETEIITALAGGVGAARFLQGLVQVVPQNDVTVVVNTGDDIELYGLNVSPDLDIIMYTLAGIVDDEKGWGLKNDTFYCLDFLRKYGYGTWFNIGDRDLATHIHRTMLLKDGLTLTQVTRHLCQKLGVKARILPMTNSKFATKIQTDEGTMHFEEYFVKKNSSGKVMNVFFEGADMAQPAPDVVESILASKSVIICPSNPIISIGTILSVKGIRDALKETKGKTVAISPIVGGRAIKGPADKIMSGLGLEVSAFAVAKLYMDFIDGFIIDQVDQAENERIEDLGLKVMVTNTIMKTLDDKIRLAKVALECANQ